MATRTASDLSTTTETTVACKSLTIFDIADTTLQQIIIFLVFDNPLPLIQVQKVNKHFYNILDAQYGGTNFIWRIICRNKWNHIGHSFHTKRWDKLYQLRIMAIKRDRGDLQVNKVTDIEDIIIEGCAYGMPNKHLLSIKENDTNDMYQQLKDFTFEDIKIKNSLYENGYVWFIKCPLFVQTQHKHNHYLEYIQKPSEYEINEHNYRLVQTWLALQSTEADEKKTETHQEAKDNTNEHEERMRKLDQLKKDLFEMTVTTVFRNLEEERIWDITESVRQRFNAQTLYELVLEQDVQWRQWYKWMRDEIVEYLRENNMVRPPPQQPYPQQQPYPPQQAYPMQNQIPPQERMMLCNICKKNVYLVSTQKEMKEHLDNGSCVSLTQKLAGNEDVGCLVM